MNDQTPQRIAAALVELKNLFPEMRIGQLVLTVAQHAKGPTVEATYDVTDDEFLTAAEELLRQRRLSSPIAASPPKVKRAG